MVRILIFFLFPGILLPLTSVAEKPPKKVTTYYYKKLKSGEGTFQNGHREGQWKKWSATGYLIESANYKNGKLDGEYHSWYFNYADTGDRVEKFLVENRDLYKACLERQKNGALAKTQMKGKYENGLKTGTWEYFTESGIKNEEKTFLRDTLNGTYKSYDYHKGFITVLRTYSMGKLNGRYEKYSPEGKAYEGGNYIMDKKDGLWIEFTSKNVTIANYSENVLNGKYQIMERRGDYEYGILFEEYTYVNGKKTGPFRQLIPGNFILEGTLVDGKREGLLSSFQNSVLIERENVKNGKRDGKYESFYAAGQKKATGNYKEGKRDGKWELWYEDGKKMCEQTYDADQIITETCYYANGKKERAEYKDKNNDNVSAEYYPNGLLKQEIRHKADGKKIITKTWNEKGVLLKTDIENLEDTYLVEPEFAFVEESASFPGGMNELHRYIAKNIRYPEMTKEMGIQGKVYAKVFILTDGSIGDVIIMKTPDELLSKEVIRVMKSMPRWSPAKKNGKAIIEEIIIPVDFKIR